MTKEESPGGNIGGGVLWAAALEEDRDDDNYDNNNFFGQETTRMMEGDYCPFVTVVSSSVEADWDVHSELSLDEEEEEEETPVETTRPTLFPPPPPCTFLSSLELELPILTPRDFHSLVRACQEREEQDWPSDEDCDPPTVCQHMILSPMKDMEEETNMRSIIVYGEI